MQVLTIPNWSFGRDSELLAQCKRILDARGVQVHFAQSDPDHNRSVTAFEGDLLEVCETLMELAEEILPRIDLNRHVGVHPRIGALDVCPFVLANDRDFRQIRTLVEAFALRFATRFEVPVFLYERSERGRHESDLPTLRKGGFGTLVGKHLNPDFGPSDAHPLWGVTVMGVRHFLLAVNVNLRTSDPTLAKTLAREIRDLRAEGDERFLGVRALGFPLASRGMSQVSMNLTLPDLTAIDPILEWVERRARSTGTEVESNELIGVIREADLGQATRLFTRKEQVVAYL